MEKFLPKKAEKDVISIRISTELLEMVDAKAVAYSISRNALINQCIIFALKHIRYIDDGKQDDTYSIRYYLEEKTTEELDSLLCYAVHNDIYKRDETVRMILEIIMEREKDIEPEITPEIRAAWEQYLKNIGEAPQDT